MRRKLEQLKIFKKKNVANEIRVVFCVNRIKADAVLIENSVYSDAIRYDGDFVVSYYDDFLLSLLLCVSEKAGNNNNNNNNRWKIEMEKRRRKNSGVVVVATAAAATSFNKRNTLLLYIRNDIGEEIYKIHG